MRRYRQTLAEVWANAKAMRLIRQDIACQAAAALFLGAIQGLVMQSMLAGSAADGEAPAAGVLQLYLASLGGKP